MARLYALLAREAAKAVVFRRGPSKQTCLISWDLARDRFEVGQWLRGRIYERRCDLSPSGDKLIYFAANFAREIGSWTAVSKPPYLTALLLWPKGDAWGGGGLFETDRRIALNHPEGQREPSEGEIPRGLKIVPLGERPGRGEDDPIQHLRRVRDGWRLEAPGKVDEYRRNAPQSWKFIEPEVYSRSSPLGGWSLEQRLRAVHVRKGPWYLYDFAVRSATGEERELGQLDWADWSRTGDLLFARDGRLFRIRARRSGPAVTSAVQVADFSDLKFERKISPPEARVW